MRSRVVGLKFVFGPSRVRRGLYHVLGGRATLALGKGGERAVLSSSSYFGASLS